MTTKTPFSPSPTVSCMLWARTALYSWLQARAKRWVWYYVLEDTDIERSNQVLAMRFRSMNWLGLTWGRRPHYYQSKRFDRYNGNHLLIVRKGTAYKMFLFRGAKSMPKRIKGVTGERKIYDGCCRDCASRDTDELLLWLRLKFQSVDSVVFDDLVLWSYWIFLTTHWMTLIIARTDGVPNI